jgi:S1-C subfamily serine protease
MFSFPIKQGSSGGPVFVAASGKMIGLASAFAGGPGTAIAAAIPVELIRPFLTAHVPPE